VTETPTPSPQPEAVKYLYEDDPKFAAGLQPIDWVNNEAYGGLILQCACPVCGHDGGVDVFVSVFVAGFTADQRVEPAYVECSCGEDHKAPSGKSGCGRWGLIIPHVAAG
jgi:hypothetical protein